MSFGELVVLSFGELVVLSFGELVVLSFGELVVLSFGTPSLTGRGGVGQLVAKRFACSAMSSLSSK